MHLIKNSIVFMGITLFSFNVFGQSLEDLMKEKESENIEYTSATFKGTRLFHGHSVEAPGRGVLQSMFSHRFGTLEDPLYTFLGMNQASIRFGFDYGINDRLAVGIGRSSGLGATTPPPTYDGYAKYRILRQHTGKTKMPVTIAIVLATAVDAERWPADGIQRRPGDRFAYTGQLLIARKFGELFSLQVMPTVVHRNLTQSSDQSNNLVGVGVGGRFKLTKRTAITGEYYYNSSKSLGAGYYNPLSIGFDIDTGGHVFQIMFTNSAGLIEPQVLGNTTTNFFSGARGIRLGFNFSRVFTIVK